MLSFGLQGAHPIYQLCQANSQENQRYLYTNNEQLSELCLHNVFVRHQVFNIHHHHLGNVIYLHVFVLANYPLTFTEGRLNSGEIIFGGS